MFSAVVAWPHMLNQNIMVMEEYGSGYILHHGGEGGGMIENQKKRMSASKNMSTWGGKEKTEGYFFHLDLIS